MLEIDSVGDENSPKMDKKKFGWKRLKNTKKVTPDAELKELIEKGGPGINAPLPLGKNLRGILQVVPAMTEFDLFVDPTRIVRDTHKPQILSSRFDWDFE